MSYVRRNSGINFDISSREMFFPRQVLAPPPNYQAYWHQFMNRPCGYENSPCSGMRTAYSKRTPLHELQRLLIRFQPSLRPVCVSIIAIHCPISRHHPRITATKLAMHTSHSTSSMMRGFPSKLTFPQWYHLAATHRQPAPPSGTTRSSNNPTAGCIRSASLMTAWRYGRFWASAKVTGRESLPAASALSISSSNF